MIVLGIDPGTAHTGFGVVSYEAGQYCALDGGDIRTSSDLPLEQRLNAIHSRISELISTHKPASIAVEDLYFGQNVGSALQVGQARGVVLLAAAQGGLDVASYTPQQIKSSVCGTGRAGKDQVQRMVQSMLRLEAPPKPDHAADALAVAICHHNRAPLAKALATGAAA